MASFLRLISMRQLLIGQPLPTSAHHEERYGNAEAPLAILSSDALHGPNRGSDGDCGHQLPRWASTSKQVQAYFPMGKPFFKVAACSPRP